MGSIHSSILIESEHNKKQKTRKTPTFPEKTFEKMFKSSVLFGFSQLATLGFADVARMVEKMKNSLNSTGVTDRAFTGAVANSLNDLINNHGAYGCWCYFYDDVGRGKGTPVDEIDAFCKLLNEGYECAIRDSEDEGVSCVPWEVDYFPGLGVGTNLYNSCKELNDNVCSIRACAIEGHFTNNLVAILLAGNSMNYADYGHFDGFDASHDAGCPVKPGVKGSPANKSCCGAYPARFPYKNLDGDRACCGSRTYNTQLLNCCEGGQVRANC